MRTLQGSLLYHNTPVTLTPGTTTIDDTLEATLSCRNVTDNAAYAELTLKNTGNTNTRQIRDVKTLDLTVDSACAPFYSSLQGDDCGATSFMPRKFTLSEPFHEEPRGGRSTDMTGFTFFDLQYDRGGVAIAIGWSGQWSKDITPTTVGFNVRIGLCDSDFYLMPGEEVRLPSVLVVWDESAEAARRAMRTIIREQFSPKSFLGDGFKVPVAIQCFDRYFQALSGADKNDAWATENGQKRTVDAALKTRYIDTIWLDAAWFAEGFPHGVGNFRFAEGFPRGLRPVADYAHEKGMKFVVWFEPERVYQGSDLYPRKEFLLLLDEDDPTRLFNLADDTARRWLTDTLIGMIRDNGIDVYRQDCNLALLPYWRKADAPDRRGITEMKYIAGLYQMWDEILAACPGVWIDNCASGGRRLDLETAKRSVTLWRSDTGCFAEDDERRVTVWNHNQILGLAQYLPYHACAVWDTDAYTVRSTATHGMACNFDIFNPDFDYVQAENVLREVEELRSYWDGDFYPLTGATTCETTWSAYQLAFEDHGAAYVFRRGESTVSQQCFCLRAVDREAEYELTVIDEHFARTVSTVRGCDLQALTVTIPNAKESAVVLYKKK